MERTRIPSLTKCSELQRADFKTSHKTTSNQKRGSVSNLVQGGAHDGDQEAVVEVIQELRADPGVCHLHHGVAELQGVHEKHERRNAHPVLPPQRMPVVSTDLDFPGQRGVEGAEPRRQHLRERRETRVDNRLQVENFWLLDHL